jgi:hypothetical protein
MEFDGNFPVAERHDQVVKAARLEDKNWGDALAVLLDGVGLHHVDAAQLVVPNESANQVVSERKGQGHFASQWAWAETRPMVKVSPSVVRTWVRLRVVLVSATVKVFWPSV